MGRKNAAKKSARKSSTSTKAATKRTRDSVAKKRTRTPDFAEWPEWSEAKFWAFVRSGLRAKWQRFPARYAALAQAKRAYVGDNKNQKWEYQCAACGQWFLQKDVAVDHIEPAGTLKTYSDLPTFVQKLFVGLDKLQVLCKACHKDKTAKERLGEIE